MAIETLSPRAQIAISTGFADIEHGVGDPIATHAGQGVDVDVVNGALHVIRAGYSLAPGRLRLG